MVCLPAFDVLDENDCRPLVESVHNCVVQRPEMKGGQPEIFRGVFGVPDTAGEERGPMLC